MHHVLIVKNVWMRRHRIELGATAKADSSVHRLWGSPCLVTQLMLLRTLTVKSLQTIAPYRAISSQQHGSASAKLWEDALEEEDKSESKSSSTTASYPNWTGDESIQDAVLRMLVDKYKPLRAGTIHTAEDKLKHTPPLSNSHSLSSTPDSGSESSTEHKPWLTTFRAPSHAGTSIKHMRLPSPSVSHRLVPPPLHPSDTNTRTRILEREKKKKEVYAGRITQARESSLDYRIGKQYVSDDGRDARVRAAPYPTRPNPNPVSIKGWTSLVEERIEVSV